MSKIKLNSYNWGAQTIGFLPRRNLGVLRLAFAGDLCLPPHSTLKRGQSGFIDCLKEIRTNLHDVDIGVVNLEGPIVASVVDKRAGVSVHLQNDPAVIQSAAQSGFKVLNLANNHIMDYGTDALVHTLKLIQKAGLAALGAGSDTFAAERPLKISIRGWKVGFLAFTTDEISVRSVLSSEGVAGCASLRNEPVVLERINSLRQEVDIVCVILHWGHEYYLYPASDQVELARRMVDAGANLVVGHHPHVVQGLEIYHGGLIAYSLGNFFFPKVINDNGRIHWEKPITRQFLLLVVDIDDQKRITFYLIPGKKKANTILVPYGSRDNGKFQKQFAQLCVPLGMPNYKEWYSAYVTVRKRELRQESILQAILKALYMPLPDLLRTVRLQDIQRNYSRLVGKDTSS